MRGRIIFEPGIFGPGFARPWPDTCSVGILALGISLSNCPTCAFGQAAAKQVYV
jgi:hypothetical protein